MDQQAHQTHTSHLERSSQTPLGFGFSCWSFLICFASIKPVNSGVTQENPTTSELMAFFQR